MKINRDQIISRSLSIASHEISGLIDSVDSDELEVLIESIIKRAEQGNIIVTGAGTSGVAANKIVHSLRCQQLPAHFLSPSDALHGASGVIQDGDLLIVISNGGTSNTVNKTADIAKLRGAQVLAVTAYRNSELARIAHDLVVVKVEQESDYASLLATASILCVIALFDALVNVIMAEHHFTKESFSQIHPDGRVGAEISGSEHEEM